MVEFALAFTVLSLLFTGVFRFGYTFYLYNSLVSGVRAGARYASQKSYTPGSGSTANNPIPDTAYVAAVKNMAVYGTAAPSDTAQPIVPGLTVDNIEVVPTVDVNSVPQSITVRISRTTPFTLNAVVGSTRLAGKPAVSFPYTGIYTAAP